MARKKMEVGKQCGGEYLSGWICAVSNESEKLAKDETNDCLMVTKGSKEVVNVSLLNNGMDRLMRLREVLEIVPVGKSTWWSWVAQEKAPASIKLGRCTFWRFSEIIAFIGNGGISNEN